MKWTPRQECVNLGGGAGKILFFKIMRRCRRQALVDIVRRRSLRARLCAAHHFPRRERKADAYGNTLLNEAASIHGSILYRGRDLIAFFRPPPTNRYPALLRVTSD